MTRAFASNRDSHMADSSPPQTDIKAQAKDYSRFIAMFKWGAILSALLTAIVIYLLYV